MKSVYYLLTYEALAREAPKDGAALLSKLALSAGVRRGSYGREGRGLAEGGGVNLYWSAG